MINAPFTTFAPRIALLAFFLGVAVILLSASSDCYCQASTTAATEEQGSIRSISSATKNQEDVSSLIRASSPIIQHNEHEHAEHERRRLQFENIWKYRPRTKITDIAAIDLDMKVLSGLLDLGRFEEAEKVYKEGGHVGSTAILELIVALDQDIPAGQSALLQAGEDDGTVSGTLYVNAKRGDKLLLISYGTTANQGDFVGCQVGALPDPKTSGCFVESGTVEFPDLKRSYEYTYKKLEENINLRTLLTLSLEAQNFVENDTFSKYREYYATPLYADEITTAGFNNRTIGTKRGDMDFSLFKDKGDKEVAEMSIVLMTIWMTVVGSMEDAVNECKIGNCGTKPCQDDKPGVFAWDAAVAYYAGSLVDSATQKGNLLFYYADKLCGDFKTCGDVGGETDGNSFVNHDIFHWFARGQRDLLENYCDGAVIAKNKIVELMTVPLIQGAIRYSHMVQGEMDRNEIEKHDAEAAGYALAVLPLVHHCSPKDAKTIYNYLKPQSPTNVDFEEVKFALEKNYHCMNVKCHHVGGIVSSTYPFNTYKEGAEPCTDLTTGLTEEQRKWALSLGITFGTLFIIAIVVCVVGKTERGMSGQSNDLQLEPSTEGEMT